MLISDVELELQRQPFARPFGFKGSCFHEKWNAVVRLTDETGVRSIGVGGLATLWADAAVFMAHTESGGNFIMLAMLEDALQQVRGRSFPTPLDMLDAVLPEVHEYGKAVTGNPDLRPTFTLNSLVALDNAAWVLHARSAGLDSFDDLIPSESASALSERSDSVAIVPAIAYKLSEGGIRDLLEQGCFFLKVKIGQAGDEQEMLRKDVRRLTEVHQIARDYETPMTENGRILYYLDANGRYREKDSMMRLLDHADSLGILDQVALIEEPFAEELDHDVHDVPARLAADESLHSVADVSARLDQGYSAIAFKPAGKTLSMAFRMVAAAHDRQAICYVADNACVPTLVDWNKNFAARLAPFPGLDANIMESNGPTTYPDWDALLARHPCAGAPWLKPVRGAFQLDDDFYARSGGVFLDPAPFAGLFRAQASG